MLLSRVAETAYWMARYVERAENTARIIMVNANLLLDLPRNMTLGWEPLLTITGSAEPFFDRHKEATERAVVKFLISDGNNHSSIISSLRNAREDLRATRSIFPREAWETLNDLYRFATDGAQSGIGRRVRYEYLRTVIQHCQQLTGLLSGTMSHDAIYRFVRMGRNLERADMTSRVLDVRAANLFPKTVEELKPFDDIQWKSVLETLAAYLMYRRHVHVRVKGAAVLGYLLQDAEFPRSVNHCLGEVESCLRALPRNETPLRSLGHVQRAVAEAKARSLAWEGMHAFLDGLQIMLGEVHEQVCFTYFGVDRPTTEPVAATA